MVLLLDLWCSLRYDTECHPFSAAVAARDYVYLQMILNVFDSGKMSSCSMRGAPFYNESLAEAIA